MTAATPTNEAEPTSAIWPGLCGTDERGPFLSGGQCRQCGYTTLEVRPICPSCWTPGSMHTTPIGRRGLLYTFTIVHQLPKGYVEPFAIGYVDLAEGVRVFAHIENKVDALRIGADLELTIAALKRDDRGASLHGPRYVKLRRG